MCIIHTFTHLRTHTQSNRSQTESAADRGLSYLFNLLRLLSFHAAVVCNITCKPVCTCNQEIQKKIKASISNCMVTPLKSSCRQRRQKGSLSSWPQILPKNKSKILDRLGRLPSPPARSLWNIYVCLMQQHGWSEQASLSLQQGPSRLLLHLQPFLCSFMMESSPWLKRGTADFQQGHL